MVLCLFSRSFAALLHMGDNKPPFRAGQEPAQEKHKHRVGLLCDTAPAVPAYDILWKGTGGSHLGTSC